MSWRHKLTRREFLYLSTLVTAGAVVTACAPKTPVATAPTEVPPPDTQGDTGAPDTGSKYKEAPMLAALVTAGTIPPVDQRLPLNPYVVDVAEMVGNYGGTIRRGFKGVADRWGPTKFIDRTLVWVDQDMVLQPRLIESWKVSADAKTYTFHLRKGLKYNDGVELKSGDFKWFYDYYATNADLQPSGWTKLTTTDENGNKVMAEADFPMTTPSSISSPNPIRSLCMGACARATGSPPLRTI